MPFKQQGNYQQANQKYVLPSTSSAAASFAAGLTSKLLLRSAASKVYVSAVCSGDTKRPASKIQ
jgi:hypothetical protein